MKKWLGCFVVLLLLESCSTVSPTDEAIKSISTSIVAIEKSLPDGCKTGSIPDQLASIKNQVAAVPSICQAEKKKLEAERDKYKGFVLAWVFIIIVYIANKILKPHAS